MRRIAFLASCWSIIMCNLVYSQYDNSFFDIDKFDRILDSSALQFHFDNLNYFRNTEYTTHVDKGSTYPGFHLLPYMQYQFNENCEVLGGLFVRYDFGNPTIKTVEPYIKFNYRLWGHELIFGNLEGGVQHDMIEPMMDYEQAITRRMEQGIQVKRENKRVEYDFWIDWRRMIYQDDPGKEEMYAGLTFDFNPILNEKTKLSIGGESLTIHNAGEIDTSKTPNVMIYNYAFGLKLKHHFSEHSSIYLAGHAAYYHDHSGELVHSFKNGLGQLAVVRVDLHDMFFVLNYWDGYQFQSPNGDRLYFSEGRQNPGNPFRYRKMAGFRVGNELPMGKNLSFMSRIGVNYNIDFQKADVIMENYIRWHFTNTPKTIHIN